jgi:hypothetical protein
MRIYFDTEFTGLHQKTTLISIGCVSDNEKEFYAEMTDFNREQVDNWIQENVLAHCFLLSDKRSEFCEKGELLEIVKGDMAYVTEYLREWLSQFESVEMWSDCLAYDWMLFCQMFGHAFNIPKNVYYIPFDLSTVLKLKGEDPDTNREKFAFGEVYQEMIVKKHNALWDAQVIKACIEKLEKQ